LTTPPNSAPPAPDTRPTDEHQRLDNIAIRRCLAGHKRGFDELVVRYERLGLYIATRYVRNTEDARDITQDAFIKAYKNLHRFELGTSFKAWFIRILKNTCIDHHRREKKRQGIEYNDGHARTDVSEGLRLHAQMDDVVPDVRYELEEVGRVYQEALDTLSEIHREVIILREVEEMKYEDIATATDAHLGTVMSRLHHARKKLQEALKPYLESIGAHTLAERAGEGVGTKRPRRAPAQGAADPDDPLP
jgi:RNA polymerase sigma-70 factor (ECF subfamily)